MRLEISRSKAGRRREIVDKDRGRSVTKHETLSGGEWCWDAVTAQLTARAQVEARIKAKVMTRYVHPYDPHHNVSALVRHSLRERHGVELD